MCGGGGGGGGRGDGGGLGEYSKYFIECVETIKIFMNVKYE